MAPMQVCQVCVNIKKGSVEKFLCPLPKFCICYFEQRERTLHTNILLSVLGSLKMERATKWYVLRPSQDNSQNNASVPEFKTQSTYWASG